MRTNCFRTVGPFLVDSCIDENGENMGHFYFARHGQTVWNVENKICGATDIGLTENGRQQARELGQKILDEQIHIDEILYLPLSRAADTARYESEITGIPARVEPRLMEQNFGKYESTPRDGAEFREAKKSFVNHYDGGESMLRLCQRIYNKRQMRKCTCLLRTTAYHVRCSLIFTI